MARLDRPALMIYGGTIKPGRGRKGDPLDIVSAFQSYGEFIAERIDEEGRFDIVRHACPGAGAGVQLQYQVENRSGAATAL